jgi:hypothetical protein
MAPRWRKRLLYSFIGLVVLYLAVFQLALPLLWLQKSAALRLVSCGHLTQLTLAMHSYCAEHDKRLPPQAIRDETGKPLLSWRVALLPYLGEKALYDQFKLDEPWDSPHNILLLDKMPTTFMDPINPQKGMTCYQVFTGPGTAFERDGLTLDDFPDGLGKTLLIVETKTQVPWTSPQDLVFHPDQPLPEFPPRYNIHFFFHEYRSMTGFMGYMGDGGHKSFSDLEDEDLIRKFITRNGGEDVDWP